MSDELIKVDKSIPKDKVLVVASALIFDEEGKVLAIKLKDTDGRTMHIPPGGRPEEGESLRDCVIREVREEVGVDINITRIAGVLEKSYETGVWTFLLYEAEITGGDLGNMEEDEIENIEFVQLEDIDHYCDMLCFDRPS